MPVVGTSAAEVLRVLPGMTPITRGNDTNRPSFTGEVYGINGNGEYQGGGYNNQSAVGNYVPNGARSRQPRPHRRRSLRQRPRLQLRDLGEPEHRVRAGAQGAPVELRGRARQGAGRALVREQAGRTRLPRLGLRPAPRLASQLERVVREQGGSGARQEPLRLPRLHAERPAPRAGHELQPRPRPRLLLPRLRVLPPAPRYGLDPLVGPHRRHARTATSARPPRSASPGRS